MDSNSLPFHSMVDSEIWLFNLYIPYSDEKIYKFLFKKKRERPHVDTFDDEPAGQRQIETKEKQDNLPRKNLHETAGHQMYVRISNSNVVIYLYHYSLEKEVPTDIVHLQKIKSSGAPPSSTTKKKTNK
jgi:hypothetical protein